MTVGAASEVHFDPYNIELNADPYPMLRRLREDVPLYYNAEHDFYALSRFTDVNKGLVDHVTFSSARGAILEWIKGKFETPPGVVSFEDPPIHDIHRSLLARMFTPRKISELEPRIREFCARSLDPLVGTGRFDFVRDLGAQMPMRVIGMLLGIPEDDQEAIRDRSNANMRTDAGKPMKITSKALQHLGDSYAAYIDWRAEHPSDDIMTELLTVEFKDETGTTRRLRRDELLRERGSPSGKRNHDEAHRLGGQSARRTSRPATRTRRESRTDPSGDRGTSALRAAGPHTARYVTRNVEYYGRSVPQGSVMMMLIGAACRDHRQFPPDGDVFDVHREPRQHLALGVGTHYCLGSALARLEGRVALEEILKRFPEWDIDLENAHLSPASTIRGWESMPAFIP